MTFLFHIFSFFGIFADGEYPWWNYPGLEVWKFVNLLLFVVVAWYFHRRYGRPVREALRARSERIKRELQTAREERDQALAKLVEVEARFDTLDAEVAAVKARAAGEAAAEKERLRTATEQEITKVRDQAKREIETVGKAARNDLRRFAAQESLRLAEEILRNEIKPEDDARLTSLGVAELGRKQA